MTDAPAQNDNLPTSLPKGESAMQILGRAHQMLAETTSDPLEKAYRRGLTSRAKMLGSSCSINGGRLRR